MKQTARLLDLSNFIAIKVFIIIILAQFLCESSKVALVAMWLEHITATLWRQLKFFFFFWERERNQTWENNMGLHLYDKLFYSVIHDMSLLSV